MTTTKHTPTPTDEFSPFMKRIQNVIADRLWNHTNGVGTDNWTCNRCNLLAAQLTSGLIKHIPEIAAAPQVTKELLLALKETTALMPGWRELIAELDDLAPNMVLRKAMIAALDQHDYQIKNNLTAIAAAEKGETDAK